MTDLSVRKAVVGYRIRFAEWLAGWLLLHSFRWRGKRQAPEDAHEMRHILAALTTGDTDTCNPANCKLDQEAFKYWREFWEGEKPKGGRRLPLLRTEVE